MAAKIVDFWQGDLMSNFLEFCVEMYREFRQTLAKMGRAIARNFETSFTITQREEKSSTLDESSAICDPLPSRVPDCGVGSPSGT
jgi:hypothetical protein